jgi:fibronectin type 3 domain-containing protein
VKNSNKFGRRHSGKPGHYRPFRPILEHLETRIAPANVDVLRSHYDNFLSGGNTQEMTLTPTNVNATNFGLLFSQPVDGYAYAQPLYKTNLTIGGGTHNVVFVATEHDSIYAYDADSNQGANASPLWKRSFIDPSQGITTVPQPDVISTDIVPEIGITGTPVIDGTTMYVVVKTKEVVSNVAHYVQRLHAVDLTTGNDRATNGVVTIGDTTIGGPDGGYTDTTNIVVTGNGAGSDSTNHLRFNALRENQRPGLTLIGSGANGLVYLSWASHGDNGPYHGWVVSYKASDLSLQQVFNTSPNNGSASGIWESGGSLAVDAQNNLYFATGNGFGVGFDPTQGDYSESVIKLSTAGQLSVADYFTPFDWKNLDNGDQDLGSGGTMLLPDSVGNAQHPHLVVEAGKTGRLYLIDRDDMGKFTQGGPDKVVQTLALGGPGVWGNPSYFQVDATTGLIYYQGSGSNMQAVKVTNATLTLVDHSNQTFGFPGSQPLISSNGTTNPIAWAIQVDNFGNTAGHAVLHAYDALNLSKELYRSDATSLRDLPSASVKFIFPIVTNGHVYVGGQTSLSVYGLFDPHTTAPAVPTGLAAMSLSDTQIQLTWTNPSPNLATGIKIERSTDGTNFTQVAIVGRNDTSFTDAGLKAATVYYYRIRATNQIGDSTYTSVVFTATHIAAPILAVVNATHAEFDLSWTKTGNDHYQIDRSFNGGNFTTIANNIPPTQTTYFDTDPILTTQKGTYSYRVTAFNQNPVDMAVSNVVSVSNAPPVLDHSAGFATHSDLTGNGSTTFVENDIRLTDGGGSEAATAFSNQRFNILSFTTTFEFRIHEGTNPRADGFTFIIQSNSPAALGPGGGGLGYGPDQPDPNHMNKGIRNSVAVKFDLFSNAGEGDDSTGIFTDGRSPTIREPGLDDSIPDTSLDMTSSGIVMQDQHTKMVTLTYDGTTLTETILDETTNLTFSHSYTVDIRSFVGSDTAYIGFGGGTGGLTSIQDILTWKYTPGQGLPGGPTALGVTSVGAADVNLGWTSNSTNEDGFKVERSDNGNTNFVQIATTTSPRFDDTNLPPGNYYYRVRAFNAVGNSSYSNVVNVVIGPISTFTDHSAGFASHSDLTANTNTNTIPIFNNGVLELTDSGGGEATSVWTNTKVGVFNFTTTFILQDQNGSGSADGVTFAIQNAGTNALGGAGGSLGYGGIGTSVAVMFDLYSSGTHQSTTKLLINGSSDKTGAINMGSAGIVLGSNHPLQITLSYDGTQNLLTETVLDMVTRALFTTTYTVNIAQTVGGATAYVGFTGGTGGETATQQILSWSGRFMDPNQPVNHLAMTAPASVTAGTPFTLTVSAENGYNAVIPGYQGTVHFTSSDPGATLPSDYTFTSTDFGVHSFTVTLGKAGNQTVTAQDTATSYIKGTATVKVNPAVTSLLAVQGFPPSTTAGVPGTFTVTAMDAFGNVATGYTGTVHFTSTDPQAVLPADATLTNGTGTFSATLKTAGSQSLTATDTVNNTITGSQAGIMVSPAAVTNFLVSDFPAPIDAGDPGAFTVMAKDPFGNTNPAYTGTVHFTSSDPQAALPDDYTFTAADQGTHNFGAVLYTAGLQSITATDTVDNTISGSQTNIQVSPLAAVAYIVSGYPAYVRPGDPQIFTVTAVDPFGNADPTYRGTVHFTSTDGQAYLPLDYTFTATDKGSHNFAAVLLTPGVQTITATDTVTGGITGSQTVTVVLPADHFQITARRRVEAGQPFTITVTALDPNGNIDRLYRGTITFTSSDPGAVLPNDYMFQMSDQGVAMFTVILNTVGNQIITVYDTSDSSINGSATVKVAPTHPTSAAGGSVVTGLGTGAAPALANATGTAPVASSPAPSDRESSEPTVATSTGSGSALPASGFTPEAGLGMTALSPQTIDDVLGDAGWSLDNGVFVSGPVRGRIG